MSVCIVLAFKFAQQREIDEIGIFYRTTDYWM